MSRTTENLLPNIVRRRQSQSRPFAKVVSLDGKTQNISFALLETASNRAAWFLKEHVAQDDKFLYMGPSDIRYLVWILAAIKAGKCVLFPSPGNTIPANQGLFQRVGAKSLLYAPEATGLLSPLLKATSSTVKAFATASYQELLSEDAAESVPSYPFEGTFDELKDKPFLGLHTSGTSGHPKPIYWNHSAAATLSAFLDPTFGDIGTTTLMRQLLQGHDLLVLFPLFHLGGIGPFMGSLRCDSTLVLPAPGTRPSPANVTSILQLANCTAMFVPPSILESMLEYLPGLEALSKLQDVGYTGGPLNPVRGEKPSKHISRLFPIIASTEGGPAHLVSTGDSSRWNAFKFLDVGQRMEEVAPGFYELVYPRNDLVNIGYAYFHTSPHLQHEYRTSDLFSSAGDDWWVYRGRTDNWIALSNGSKMDPTDMENLVSSHPLVSGVLAAGSHRFRLCMLIELKEPVATQEERDAAFNELWPLIHEANKSTPKYGQVPKELVLFATKDKPFQRASKGTIQRRLTIMDYAQEIDDRYSQVEEGLLTSGLPSLHSTQYEDLVPFLTELYSETLESETDIQEDDDVFARGLDSLVAFVLVARLKAALRNYGVSDEKLQSIDHKLVYTNPTIGKLAKTLSTILTRETNGDAGHSTASSHQVDLESLIHKQETELRSFLNTSAAAAAQDKTPEQQTVILTGSTGSVGSYILSSLLARSDVKKVFCLNRGADAQAKQISSFKSRGLPDLPNDSDRVTFLQTSLHEPQLGLSDAVYATLVHEATSIVHNAFPVNFLWGVESFDAQFRALLNFFRLATQSPNSPPVLFVSSIAAATSIGKQQQSVPEAVLPASDSKHLLQQGYAQAKYVCERLLQTYAAESGRPATVLRVGQVSGPLTGSGTWNVAEWAPSLFVSSKFLGAAPESVGGLEINWVPVDELGRIISELLIYTTTSTNSIQQTDSRDNDTKGAEPFAVYNVLNPHTTPWEALLPALRSAVPQTVSPEAWIEKLEGSARDAPHLVDVNPAIKLVDFYKEAMLSSNDESRPRIEQDNLLRGSETARKLAPIRREDLARWMQGWGL